MGKAASYTNAGTVEFIVSPAGDFYFLEVNTRLQVEHPVTEAVTGIDLVREQIRIAQGEALGYEQGDIAQSGAAIECRLYAEDCDNDFLPCSGTILDFHAEETAGLRLDTGVQSGSEISIHYDPMLAKVITLGRDRGEARLRMRRALERLCSLGTTTNREFLLRVLGHEKFAAGTVHTNFLAENADSLARKEPAPELVEHALIAATFAGYEMRKGDRSVLTSMRPGFRNSRWRDARESYLWGEMEQSVQYRQGTSSSLLMRVGEAAETEVALASGEIPGTFALQIGEFRRRFRVVFDATRVFVHVDGTSFDLRSTPRFPDRSTLRAPGSCTAPMPGRVVQVLAENGAAVEEGDTLLILEAMKMEHRICADQAGTVTELEVNIGDQVVGDQILAVVQASES